eukprot:TRINITY_DN261_c0_g1_i1.p1 TRINITY_DN261_c0_g1~~TRINITY_DN261_c0_g1_i1.p1  ORF type:complete len:365 (+),score=92.14 TRINITY_DN261_c0_g1_i1:65-1159(+)
MKIILVLIITLGVWASDFKLRERERAKKILNKSLEQLADTDFGQHIAETISMQIEMGGNVDDVLRLLSELKASLLTEQKSEESSFATEKMELETAISNNDKLSAQAMAEADDAANKLRELNGKKAQLEAKISVTLQQLELIKKQRVQMEESHEKDSKEYGRRSTEQNEVIQVLERIIQELTEQVLASPAATSLIETKKILARLPLISSMNPVAALLQLSTSLDRELVREIITKLELIRDSLKSALRDDDEAIKRANILHDTLLKKITELEDNLHLEIQGAQKELTQIDSDIVLLNDRKDSNQKLSEQATAAMENTKTNLQNLVAVHQARSQDRSTAVELVEKAIQIMRVNEEGLKERTGEATRF